MTTVSLDSPPAIEAAAPLSLSATKAQPAMHGFVLRAVHSEVPGAGEPNGLRERLPASEAQATATTLQRATEDDQGVRDTGLGATPASGSGARGPVANKLDATAAHISTLEAAAKALYVRAPMQALPPDVETQLRNLSPRDLTRVERACYALMRDDVIAVSRAVADRRSGVPTADQSLQRVVNPRAREAIQSRILVGTQQAPTDYDVAREVQSTIDRNLKAEFEVNKQAIRGMIDATRAR